MEAHSQQLQRAPVPATHITLGCEQLCYSTDLKANDPITFLFQLLLHSLENQASLGSNDNIPGTFHFGFIYSPYPQSLERTRGLPHQFQPSIY